MKTSLKNTKTNIKLNTNPNINKDTILSMTRANSPTINLKAQELYMTMIVRKNLQLDPKPTFQIRSIFSMK